MEDMTVHVMVIDINLHWKDKDRKNFDAQASSRAD